MLGADAGGHTSAMLIYSGNCNHLGLGTCRSVLDQDQAEVRKALRSCGLDTHNVIECSLFRAWV